MLGEKILRGTSWLLAGRLISNLLGLASTLIAARLLMPEDFGVMAFGMSVFAIASAVVELPVGTALVQMKSVEREDFNTAWTINVLRGVVVALLMLAAAWPVAMLTGDERIAWVVIALAAYPLVTGLRNSWFEQYIREMDFRREALLDVLAKIASIVVIVWVALETRSYWALPAGVISAALVATLLTFILRPQLPAFSLRRFRKFFGFSLWIGLGNIADSIRDAATTLLLGRLAGNAKLGAFSVGSQFAERLELVLYAPMERTLFAAFASIQDDMERVRKAYLKALHTGFAIILPVCTGIALLANEIILIALGPDWADAVPVLAFIAPATALYLIAGLSNALTNALGQPQALFRFKILSLLIHIPMMLAGLLLFGFKGGLVACAATAFLWYLMSIHVASRLTKLSHWAQVSVLIRTIISAGMMSAAVLVARHTLLAGPGESLMDLALDAGLLAGLGAAVHIACHILLWRLSGRGEGIERSVMSVLQRRLRRPQV